MRYVNVFIENCFLAKLFTFSLKVVPSSLKNSARLGGNGQELTNAEFLVVNSLYWTSCNSTFIFCNVSIPFSELIVIAETPLSSSISGIKDSILQKSPNVISLPLLSCFAGQA